MSMVIKQGMANIKAFIARDLAYATYYANGTWTKTKIREVRQMSGDRVGIYLEFGKDSPNRITGIRLYGQDGLVWAENTSLNLQKTKFLQGFLYRYVIHIVQEPET